METICITLNVTIKKNVITMGKIARFNNMDNRLFHKLEADNISEALSSTIRHTTVMTLNSDTPIVENMPTTEDVVLRVLLAVMVLVVLNVLLTVLIIDNKLTYSPTYLFSLSLLRL